MRLIYDLVNLKPSKRGWTYFLLSDDKRKMKIGHTMVDLNARVYQHLHNSEYKKYSFNFYVAIDSAEYESKFHSYFAQYRACYIWGGHDGYGEYFTKKEAQKKARSLSMKLYGHIRQYEFLLREHVTITRNEIFHIPPRKIGINLKNLIVNNL